MTAGDNFVDSDTTDSGIEVTETAIEGFRVRAGCYLGSLGHFVLADHKNHLRLFNPQTGSSSAQVKRISSIARCFAFDEAGVVFFTFRNQSLLVSRVTAGAGRVFGRHGARVPQVREKSRLRDRHGQGSHERAVPG